ncbi:MAG: hypothetical protein U0795_23645 [Pirellulales bacterium]
MSKNDLFAISVPSANVGESHEIAAMSPRLSFARQRWHQGAVALFGATAMLVAGGFLLSQLSDTPKLVPQMVALSLLLIGGGLAMVPGILRDLFGSVVVNEGGIQMQPALIGFSVPWSQVDRWEVHDTPHLGAAAPVLKVWVKGQKEPRTVPGGYLSHHDVQRLRHALAGFNR